MWTSTTAAVTSYHFNTTGPHQRWLQRGRRLGGFAVLDLQRGSDVVRHLDSDHGPPYMGLKASHMTNLFCGGLGFVSFVFISDPFFLLISMVVLVWLGIDSVASHALLSTVIPYQKMGLFMGIFNFFIVLPQFLAASILGIIVGQFFGGEPVYALVVGEP